MFIYTQREREGDDQMFLVRQLNLNEIFTPLLLPSVQESNEKHIHTYKQTKVFQHDFLYIYIYIHYTLYRILKKITITEIDKSLFR